MRILIVEDNFDHQLIFKRKLESYYEQIVVDTVPDVKRAKELSLMNQIAHHLTRSLDIDAICGSIAKSILKNFKNFNVAIFLIENGDIVLKKLSRGFKARVPKNLKIKFGEGIVGTVAKTGRMYVANDVSKNARYRTFGKTCTKSELTVPLKFYQKTIGVLNIECTQLNAFNKNSIGIVELIADRLSVALHNAQLYQDATNRAKEFAVAFTISKSLIFQNKRDFRLD